MASSSSESLALTNKVEPTRLASLARLCGTLNYFLAQTESNITCEPCTNVTWLSKFLRLANLDRAARNHSYNCLAPSLFSLDHQASSFAGSARGALPDVSRSSRSSDFWEKLKCYRYIYMWSHSLVSTLKAHRTSEPSSSRISTFPIPSSGSIAPGTGVGSFHMQSRLSIRRPTHSEHLPKAGPSSSARP
jgi:hypothetical protein